MQTAVKAAQGRLTAENIREHYDRFAWAYRFYWGDHIHHGLFRTGSEPAQAAQENLIDHCAGRAGIAAGMRVADVGCGHGGTARFLAEKYGCHVLGLTISSTQWKLAQKLSKGLNGGNGAVQFELVNAENYEFAKGGFDVVWNMESSEHFFDKPAYLRRAAAALKPGGKIMISAWTGSMQHQTVQEIARVFLCPELWTLDMYVQAMQSAGLQMVSREQLGKEVIRTWEICAEHVRQAGPLLKILPDNVQEFAAGIDVMLEAYKTGQLTYSILVGKKE
jgi:tocopherol O-methyltransferase